MIPLPLIPWLLLGVVALVGVSGATGYWQGGRHRADAIYAQQARDAATTEKAQAAALQEAADRIVKLDIKNKTIHAKTEVITREVPVYGSCRHDPDGLRNVNEALTGDSQPAPDSKLPAADAPGK